MGIPAYTQALRDLPMLPTPRLLLRRPDERDIASIVAIAGDWEVARRLTRMPHPYTEADARFFLDTVVTSELTWVIVDRSRGEVCGVIGLAPCAGDRQGQVELGYYLARTHWGHGLATEAAAVVLAFGIGLVGRSRLVSGYFADNPASGRVLEKLGFVRTGTATRPCLTMGRSVPSVEVALL